MNKMKQYRRSVSLPSIREIGFMASENAPDFIVDVLFDWLDEYIKQEVEIQHDQTLQFGFNVLRNQISDGRMSLQSPDYLSMPINWIDDLTNKDLTSRVFEPKLNSSVQEARLK